MGIGLYRQVEEAEWHISIKKILILKRWGLREDHVLLLLVAR
jgi:hypothetical protein